MYTIILDTKDTALMNKAFNLALNMTARLALTLDVYRKINADMAALSRKFPRMDDADLETFDMVMSAAMIQSVDEEYAFGDLYGRIMDDQIAVQKAA